jgi:3-phenylpropionate/trans-cinnamate dioxygenase ferredoxin component
MASDFVTVAKTDEIGAGALESFDVSGTRVSVANVAGTFYAFDDVCTHKQCSLSDGELEGRAITCPCHGSRFDVITGAVLNPPAVVPVRTYAIRVEDDVIAVQV